MSVGLKPRQKADSRTERVANFFEIPVLIAAFLVIPTIIIEESSLGMQWGTVANWLNWFIWVIFLIEAVMLFSIAENKRQWLVHHPLEVAIVLFTSPLVPPGLQSARALRLLRLLRLIRLIRITQLVNRLFSLEGLIWAIFLATIIVIGGGAAFTIVEKSQNLTEWDGIYWAISTVTTVGSDIVPSTTTGRIISIGVLFVGTGFVAILTAAIAERFIRFARHEAKADTDILRQLNAINSRLDGIEKKLNQDG